MVLFVPFVNSMVVSDAPALIVFPSISVPIAFCIRKSGLALPEIVLPRKVLFCRLVDPPSDGVSDPVKV